MGAARRGRGQTSVPGFSAFDSDKGNKRPLREAEKGAELNQAGPESYGTIDEVTS